MSEPPAPPAGPGGGPPPERTAPGAGPPPPLDPLPRGFVPWRSDHTPPPDFWRPAGWEPEDDEDDERVDLWATVGGVRPWGTAVLLFAWCLVFAVMAVRGEVGDSLAYRAWGSNLSTARGWDAAWRMLAYTFLHASPAHLFFNGLAMAILGPAVERVFTRSQFWLIFAAGGAASALASQAWRQTSMPDAVSSSIGASGAIFALGGAMLAAAWRLRRRLPPSRARALAGGLLPLLLQGLVAGFQKPGTDNPAHLGGLVAGLAMGLALGFDPRLSGRALPEWTRTLGTLGATALLLSLAVGAWSGLLAGGAG